MLNSLWSIHYDPFTYDPFYDPFIGHIRFARHNHKILRWTLLRIKNVPCPAPWYGIGYGTGSVNAGDQPASDTYSTSPFAQVHTIGSYLPCALPKRNTRYFRHFHKTCQEKPTGLRFLWAFNYTSCSYPRHTDRKCSGSLFQKFRWS